jgi:hypothetical protein
MIQLGKLDKGVAIFDLIEGRILRATYDVNNNIKITMDTSQYKPTRNPHWKKTDIDILRRQQPELCQFLDVFYSTYLNILKSNANRYSLEKKDSSKFELIKPYMDDKVELIYPSDNQHYEEASSIGIIKYDTQAYVFRFNKGIISDKNEVLIKGNNEARFPEIYHLFGDLIEGLSRYATKGYHESHKELVKNMNKNGRYIL